MASRDAAVSATPQPPTTRSAGTHNHSPPAPRPAAPTTPSPPAASALDADDDDDAAAAEVAEHESKKVAQAVLRKVSIYPRGVGGRSNSSSRSSAVGRRPERVASAATRNRVCRRTPRRRATHASPHASRSLHVAAPRALPQDLYAMSCVPARKYAERFCHYFDANIR